MADDTTPDKQKDAGHDADQADTDYSPDAAQVGTSDGDGDSS